MSRVSISKSLAILAAMESYTRAKRIVKGIESSTKHEKDKIFHPDKLRQLEEERKDKSQSAEKERQHLERLRLEEEKSGQSMKKDESMSSNFARKLKFG